MRTRQEIKTLLTSEFMRNALIAERYGFTLGSSFKAEFSELSLENIIFDIVAFCVYTLELLFGQHKRELTEMLYNQKSGRLAWYRDKLLGFQFGFNLLSDSDEYDNTGATDAEIESSRIIKYSAATEADDQSRIILKIAGESAGELAPITQAQRDAVEEYINRFRYAGIPLTLINYEPDLLYLGFKIYRDPLVIDANGTNIRTGKFPVVDALKEFLLELPFDGEFVVQALVDKFQEVEGVLIAHPMNLATAWIDPQAQAYGAPVPLDVKKIPESGYYKIADDGLDGPYGIEYVV